MQDTEADLRAQTDALREEVRIKGMECSHLENAVKSVQNELDQARGESEEEQKRIDALEFEKHSLEVSMQQVLEASRRWEDNCNDLMKASSTLEETKSNLVS
jgi:chromosome segregation ATPase